ncbi:hypothetical protein ACH3XW_35625 [Acanthocheilonema viteae]
MSRNIEEGEEEEEEEEEDEAPVTLRKSTGFKMVTSIAPTVNQNATEITSSTDSQPTKIVHETRTESYEEQTPNLAEVARKEAELNQARIIAEQKEAMERAQQEALQRAQLAQQQAIKEAQERAKREAQMRVQEAQAEAKAKQAEAEAKAKQAQAEAKAKQAEAEAKKRAEQEAQRRAQREAQIKAERERAEQLRAQQQAKMMAAKQPQQPQVQAQNLQQNQPLNVQQRQQQQQPQMMTKQSQIQASNYQAPIKQVQQTPQQQQQKKGPAVPTKPEQTSLTRQTAPSAIAAGGPAGHKLSARGVLQAQASPASATLAQQQTSGAQLIPNIGDKIQVMRGGDVQQAYLNSLNKPAEVLPQQEIKPIHAQDDQSWVTQNRIPVEIQAPQPAKITIPELHGSVEVKPTVIVPRPAQTTRVEWNEFPQEGTKELIDVPRIKAGEWHPDNQGEIIGAQPVRSAYQPGRIGHVWPPQQSENVPPPQEVKVTKTAEDTTWRRDEKVETETGPAWGKTVPHNLQRVWPPPENEVRIDRSVGSRLKTIQWPPPEFEQQIQQDVDILQTRLPVKPNQRQWPPPPPEYAPAVEQNETKMDEKITTKQAPAQQMQNRTTTTTITRGMVRVGEAR